jgi:hypothetical protein
MLLVCVVVEFTRDRTRGDRNAYGRVVPESARKRSFDGFQKVPVDGRSANSRKYGATGRSMHPNEIS